ncbi:unnamed protein product [Echinostoma caproni]|uniref:IPPc domain-containing protein n=1 Tax=Echinostoma caproni TaxID=27848 RepID=A0A183AA50_9TREM|nr:unnamed protein product [Echinostoma caproni]
MGCFGLEGKTYKGCGNPWNFTALRLEADQYEDQNLVIFGDFNFRLNLPLYVQRLQTTHTLPRSPATLTAEAGTTWNEKVDTGKSTPSDIVIERKVFQVLSADRLTWSNFQPLAHPSMHGVFSLHSTCLQMIISDYVGETHEKKKHPDLKDGYQLRQCKT